MTDAPSDLAKLIRAAVAALRDKDWAAAKWSAVFAGGELERLARQTGGAVAWPAEFAAEPLKGWAEYGVKLARRTFLQRGSPGAVRADWKPKAGGNFAAHAVSED